MISTIITDKSALRKKSQPSKITNGNLTDESQDVIQSLIDSIPDNGVGLAAPQINQFERIFIAKLSFGYFAFVNPSLSEEDKEMLPSEEGCLSIPDIVWCVDRYKQVTISADLVFKIDNGVLEKNQDDKMTVTYRDAFIVQHEFDHLDGILMIDYPKSKTEHDKSVERAEVRERKIKAKRAAKQVWLEQQKVKKAKKVKVNRKQAAKIKAYRKSAERREKRRVEIQERNRAEQEGLFDDATSEV